MRRFLGYGAMNEDSQLLLQRNNSQSQFSGILKEELGYGFKGRNILAKKRDPQRHIAVACEVQVLTGFSIKTWKTKWLEIAEGAMYLYTNESDTKSRVAEVIGFVSHNDPFDLESANEMSEVDAATLKDCHDRLAFVIFTEKQLYQFRAKSESEKDQIVEKITRHLKNIFEPHEWRRKEQIFMEIRPSLIHEELVSIRRREFLVNALEASGVVGQSKLISNTFNEKFGALEMHKDSLMAHDSDLESGWWEELYFVLSEGSLYFFKSDQSAFPEGFVSLRYGTLHLESESIQNNEFIFLISTPTRSIHLKARHEVALSEWVSELQKSKDVNFAEENQKKDKYSGFTAAQVLREIQLIKISLSSLSVALNSDVASQEFYKFLKEQGKENFLDCMREIREFSLIEDEDENVRVQFLKEHIIEDFIAEDGNGFITCIPKEMQNMLCSTPLSDITTKELKELCSWILSRLEDQFTAFKSSARCDTLVKGATGNSQKDSIFRINDNQQLALEITSKGKSKSRLIRLDMSKSKISIGRDESNDLILLDDRASRSHANLDYSREMCRISDLGSSHGTKVNDVNERGCYLQIGDVIKIGDTKIVLVSKELTFFKKTLRTILNPKGAVTGFKQI